MLVCLFLKSSNLISTSKYPFFSLHFALLPKIAFYSLFIFRLFYYPPFNFSAFYQFRLLLYNQKSTQYKFYFFQKVREETSVEMTKRFKVLVHYRDLIKKGNVEIKSFIRKDVSCTYFVHISYFSADYSNLSELLSVYSYQYCFIS